MYDIRTALQANLLPIAAATTDLYFELADEEATFPYIVYSFDPISTDDESGNSLILNVDGWDAPSNGDSTTLEQLMQTIDGDGNIQNPTGLNEKIITTTEVTIILRRALRYAIPDNDPTIKRKRYTYNLTVFERS